MDHNEQTMTSEEFEALNENAIIDENDSEYIIDCRTGLGAGIYQKKNWTLEEALYDQNFLGENINLLD